MGRTWKVPEKWCVKVTTIEQDKVLTDYLNDLFHTDYAYDPSPDGISTWFSNELINDLDYRYSFRVNKPLNTIEITYEQFVNYILNPIFEESVVIKNDLTYLGEFLKKLNII